MRLAVLLLLIGAATAQQGTRIDRTQLQPMVDTAAPHGSALTQRQVERVRGQLKPNCEQVTIVITGTGQVLRSIGCRLPQSYCPSDWAECWYSMGTLTSN